MSRRTERVNELLRDELSELVTREVQDPRLSRAVFSFVGVETSTDLRSARVRVSVLGSEEDKEAVLSGLESASGFLHREVKKRCNLRTTPLFTFTLDETIEKADALNRYIDQVRAEDQSARVVEPKESDHVP